MHLRRNDDAVNSIAYYWFSTRVTIWRPIGLKDNDLHFHHMEIQDPIAPRVLKVPSPILT